MVTSLVGTRHRPLVPRQLLFSTVPTRLCRTGILVSVLHCLSAPSHQPIIGVTPSGSLLDDMQTLERAITQFVPSMIPIHQLDAASPEDKPAIIVAHTLAQATMIHLYRRFAQSDGVSYAKCLRAAHACVAIIKHLSEADFTLLEPIISVSEISHLIFFPRRS